ncbi:hypothetical protein L228DRAFT_268266 [Xylona heveae TC161]|uniref:Uncharacterized protein n=1 Tax=Xylona heveae (strain CBS 132557 / TC161) TaxID=1328760 RepID=A0A165H285_XYLHT|nr:hypothetical protein L228DRAFT_268266 [Xylona heveae TC161]KZF22888.1 hypothetical protein L228DRAFT_268266 [Xylona heveae TC161]
MFPPSLLKRPFIDDEPPYQGESGLDTRREEKRPRTLPIRTSPSTAHRSVSSSLGEFQEEHRHTSHHSKVDAASNLREDAYPSPGITKSHGAYLDPDVDMSDENYESNGQAQLSISNPSGPDYKSLLSLNQCWKHQGGFRPSSTGSYASAWNTLESKPECQSPPSNPLQDPGEMMPALEPSSMPRSPSAEPDVDMDESDSVNGNKRHRENSKLVFSMGFRADCEKCLMRVPGHYSHVYRREE